MADALLGTSYISAGDLKARSLSFGCAKALGALDYPQIEAVCAMASRAIDAHTGRAWDGGTITENHAWEPATRRVKINQPPIMSLLSYKIRTSPNSVSTFPVTPVTVDAGGRNVSYGAIYYNYQENYLELASLVIATGLTTTIIALGMYQPQVEISYTSHATIPEAIITATGLVAADMANTGYLNSLMLPGLQSVSDGDQSMTRVPPVLPGNYSYPLPMMAVQILSNLSRPAIG